LRNGSAPLSLPIRPSICLRPFIIFFSCACCLRSRFTSATWVPLPRAIRSRRLPLISAGVSRSVAMQLTGHKTEAVYRRYAIVSEGDLGAGLEKLGQLAAGTKAGTIERRGKVKRFKKA